MWEEEVLEKFLAECEVAFEKGGEAWAKIVSEYPEFAGYAEYAEGKLEKYVLEQYEKFANRGGREDPQDYLESQAKKRLVEWWNQRKEYPEPTYPVTIPAGGPFFPGGGSVNIPILPNIPFPGDGSNPITTSQMTDPLVLDLTGTGLQTTSASTNNAYFDYKGNGFVESTGWVSESEGILVRDINGDGVINNGGELFGDQTLLAEGSYAANGFTALAALDDNGDGVIDASDTAWSSLDVWVDANGDGVEETGELHTLSELGIKSLSLSSIATNTTDSSGNTQIALGSYTKADGRVEQMGDYKEVFNDIAALPYLPGYKTVYDSLLFSTKTRKIKLMA
jgi:hypothetical protein